MQPTKSSTPLTTRLNKSVSITVSLIVAINRHDQKDRRESTIWFLRRVSGALRNTGAADHLLIDALQSLNMTNEGFV